VLTPQYVGVASLLQNVESELVSKDKDENEGRWSKIDHIIFCSKLQLGINIDLTGKPY